MSSLFQFQKNTIYKLLLKSTCVFNPGLIAEDNGHPFLKRALKIYNKHGPNCSLLWILQTKSQNVAMLILKNGFALFVIIAKSSLCTILSIDPPILDSYIESCTSYFGRYCELDSVYKSLKLILLLIYQTIVSIPRYLTIDFQFILSICDDQTKIMLHQMYERIDINKIIREIYICVQCVATDFPTLFQKYVALYNTSIYQKYLNKFLLDAKTLIVENKYLIMECMKAIVDLIFKLGKIILPGMFIYCKKLCTIVNVVKKLIFNTTSRIVYTHPIIWKILKSVSLMAFPVAISMLHKMLFVGFKYGPQVFIATKNMTAPYLKLFIKITPYAINLLRNLFVQFIYFLYKINCVTWPVLWNCIQKMYEDLKPAIKIFCNEFLPKMIAYIRNASFYVSQILHDVYNWMSTIFLQTLSILKYYNNDLSAICMLKEVYIFFWNIFSSIELGFSIALEEHRSSSLVHEHIQTIHSGLVISSSDILLAAQLAAPAIYTAYKTVLMSIIHSYYIIDPQLRTAFFTVASDIVTSSQIAMPVLRYGMKSLSYDIYQSLETISPMIWLSICTVTPAVWNAAVEVTPSVIIGTIEFSSKTTIAFFVVIDTFCMASSEISETVLNAISIIHDDTANGYDRLSLDIKTLLNESFLFITEFSNRRQPVYRALFYEAYTLFWILHHYDFRSRKFRDFSESHLILKAIALQCNVVSAMKQNSRRIFKITLKFVLFGKFYISKSNSIALSTVYEVNLRALQYYHKMEPYLFSIMLKTFAYFNTLLKLENSTLSYFYFVHLKLLISIAELFSVNNVDFYIKTVSQKFPNLVEMVSYLVCLKICKLQMATVDGVFYLSPIFWSFIKSVISDLWNWTFEVSPIVWQFIETGNTTIWNFLIVILPLLYKLIREQSIEFWDSFHVMMPYIYEHIKNLSPHIWIFIHEMASAIWICLREKSPEIWDYIQEICPKIWQQLCETCCGNWQEFKNSATHIWYSIRMKSFISWKLHCILTAVLWELFMNSSLSIFKCVRDIDPLVLGTVCKLGASTWNVFCFVTITSAILYQYNFSVSSISSTKPSMDMIDISNQFPEVVKVHGKSDTTSIRILYNVLENMDSVSTFVQKMNHLIHNTVYSDLSKRYFRVSKFNLFNYRKISKTIIPKNVYKSCKYAINSSYRFVNFLNNLPSFANMSSNFCAL